MLGGTYMAFIIDTTKQQVISPSDLFGNESNSLLEACYRIFQGSLYPYKGVYNSPLRPSILQYRQEYLANGGDPKDFIYFTRHEIILWDESHPEEIEKEARSRKEWEKNRENDFQFIAETSARHNIQLQWIGGAHPDVWNIYSNDVSRKMIAEIHCI